MKAHDMNAQYGVKMADIVILLVTVFLFSGTPALAQEKFKLKEGAKGKLCLNCHVTFLDKMKQPFVHTPLRRGECSGCHNPHTSSRPKLLGESVDRVCLRCHKPFSATKGGSIHAVVAEGRCVRCHDPHSGPNKNNLLAAGNQLCFSCHKEMGEAISKVKHQHDPADKNCLTCHTPHVSADMPFLLKEKAPPLCTRCHKTDRPIFAKQHMNYPVGKSVCTSCHNPHGSQQKGILYDTVHKPVASRMCNQCHQEPSSPDALKTKNEGVELCKGCHNPMIKDIFDKKRLHWPVAGKSGCRSCHSPHASKQKGLLRQAQSALCGSCHQDTMEHTAKLKTQHNPVKEGMCSACHSPHSSDNAQLIAQAEITDLCSGCHDWRKHSTHPVGQKFRDPRDKNLAVDCSSCHRTHGTDYKRLLLHATITEVCVQCHEKYRR